MYCPKGQKLDDPTNLLARGELIFMADEEDKKSAAAFLIILLDCIEKWANQHTIQASNGEKSQFYHSYQELVKAKVIFPSQAKK